MKCEFCHNNIQDGAFEYKGKWYCSQECMIQGQNKPKEIIGWELVEEQIKKNSYPRINWKPLLNMSLTRAIAKFKAAGLNAEQAYKILVFEHPDWSDEVKRRLKIGIAARFGEMATSQSELKKVKA